MGSIDKTVPPDWFVIVTTDRGLYAEWLYQQILNCGWHPFMRINLQGQFQIKGTVSWLPLNTLVREVGQSFESLVTCFKSNPIECTLLARHDEGYAEPWLILTDLQPEVADACWYSMRSWIECLFKDGKRGGFAWHQTKMTDTKRAERHWLAIAIATLWQVSVGGSIDANLPISSLDELPQTHVARRNLKNSVFHRCLSCFRRGFLVIKAAVLNRLPLPQGSFFPEPWPSLTPQLHVSQITLSTA